MSTYNLIYNAALLVEEGVGYALALDKLVNTTETATSAFALSRQGWRWGCTWCGKSGRCFPKRPHNF